MISPRFKRLRQLVLLCALVVTSFSMASAAVSTSNANYSASEVHRVKLNSDRLLKMNPVQARRVNAVLHDLEGHGLRPLIDSQVWRSPAQQAELVRRGYSKVYYSFHTVSRTDPKTHKVLADSLAADVVDYERQWNADRSFWLKLNSAALSHQSETGIAWGLSTVNRQRLALAVATKEWGYKGPLGWDTAHIQCKGITLGQAKKGVRPK